MSVRDIPTRIYCGFCGYRISESDDNAGHLERRANGQVLLHKNGYCAPQWDKEYAKHVEELEPA
jgi:ATP-dependent helicase YprA (DUF1998 family)